MERQHINERGSHTTTIEQAVHLLSILKKTIEGVQISPGKIEANIGAKSSSVKLKHINNELYEMVVVHNGARQEFKIFTRASYDDIKKAFKNDKKLREWNCNYTDMRGVHRSDDTFKNFDGKYKV
ncbi:MAG: hypothetical protein RLZZ308_243 [Candidatus Parcubacteria bacterium]|jgi:hypothetical protein